MILNPSLDSSQNMELDQEVNQPLLNNNLTAPPAPLDPIQLGIVRVVYGPILPPEMIWKDLSSLSCLRFCLLASRLLCHLLFCLRRCSRSGSGPRNMRHVFSLCCMALWGSSTLHLQGLLLLSKNCQQRMMFRGLTPRGMTRWRYQMRLTWRQAWISSLWHLHQLCLGKELGDKDVLGTVSQL